MRLEQRSGCGGCFGLLAGHDVGVAVEGEADRGMAETFADDLDVDAGHQQVAGVGVAEVVEADHRDVGVGDEAAEGLADRAGLQRFAEVGGEDPVARRGGDAVAEVVLALAGSVPLQRGERRGVEVERAAAAAGLRHADELLALDDGHRLVDRQAAAGEVDVAPAQPDQLAASHAGERGEAEHRFVAVAGDEGEEAAELVGGPRLHLRRAGPGGGLRRVVGEAGDVALIRPLRSASLSILLSAVWTCCTVLNASPLPSCGPVRSRSA